MVRYDSYKEVDVEWIGVIPTDWKCIKLGYIFRPVSIKNTEGEINLSVYRDYGVIPTDSRDDNHNVVSEDISNYKLVTKGDFVMNKMKCWMGSIGISKYRGIVSPSYTVLKLIRNDVVGDFFHYLLRCQLYIPEYRRLSYGVRIGQWDLRFEDFREIKGLIPPLTEQHHIVQYLDNKTTLIDTLIQKTQEKINLLREKRTSLINHTITKGLNPDVEMKDSGVEWIGEIPKHWERTKIKTISSVISKGTTPSTIGKDVLDEGEIRYLKSENIVDNSLSILPQFFIDNETNEILKRSILYEGDILFVIAGASIGKTTILTKEFSPSNTNQAVSFIRLKSNENNRFVWYWLTSSKIQEQIWMVSVQSAQPNLSMENLGNFSIPYPQHTEQQQIVEYLDEQTKLIDTLIQREEKRIELLKEYRQSLISDVVTGKIKVTDHE